ncbi:MAG: CHAT domain-containing protein [Cyanobacteria bacterium P01_D01_bin.36]
MGISLLGGLKAESVAAQSITPALDGTGTTVTQSQQQFNIEGGQLSATGDNLFHSFQTFQPNVRETVNFETTPSVQNVFARVRGNQPSVIDGALQISGSQANLFLMNPAGILFGPNATLNLPADFTATTANAIGIGNGDDWFNTKGVNDYTALVGDATAFAFASSQPGVVVNEGELSLNEGQQLSMIAGNTINTGTVATSGGGITMAAVPGENIVRLSQEGQLLTLELEKNSLQTQTELGVTVPTFSPLRLPALLTNDDVSEVTQLTVNANGTVSLTSATASEPVPVVPANCSAQACAIASGTLDVSNVAPDPFSMLPPIGGTIGIQGRYVDLSAAIVDVSGLAGDGNLFTEIYEPNGSQLPEASISTGINDQLTNSLNGLNAFQGPNMPFGAARQGRNRGNGNSQINRTDRQGNNRSGRGQNARGRLHHFASRTVLDNASADEALRDIEDQRVQEFSDYFGRSLNSTELTPDKIQTLLADVYTKTGNQSVIAYITAPSADTTEMAQFTGANPSIALESNLVEQPSTPLEILLFTATEEPIRLIIPDVSRSQLFQTTTDFNNTLITSVRRGTDHYLEPAQQLYEWLIQPIEDELGPGAVDTFLFSMDSGLRSIPIAALHDGQQFLVENYSVGMVPSLSLMDAEYQPIEKKQVLAMGASDFDTLQPLPAVPAEIETIGQLWQSQKFLNESFTLQNLIQQQSQNPAQIIHLATHAEFNSGDANSSYIQLWNEQLQLSDIHTLGWAQPAVDLLVLSACRTALGNPEAEMGFAGLSIATGVKSALASLWSVSDLGTLALMGEFYDQLRTESTKSEALQQAQLSMLHGDIRVESGQLFSDRTRSTLALPSALSDSNPDLSHPYYWSGFTMIGSPW